MTRRCTRAPRQSYTYAVLPTPKVPTLLTQYSWAPPGPVLPELQARQPQSAGLCENVRCASRVSKTRPTYSPGLRRHAVGASSICGRRTWPGILMSWLRPQAVASVITLKNGSLALGLAPRGGYVQPVAEGVPELLQCEGPPMRSVTGSASSAILALMCAWRWWVEP